MFSVNQESPVGGNLPLRMTKVVCLSVATELNNKRISDGSVSDKNYGGFDPVRT